MEANKGEMNMQPYGHGAPQGQYPQVQQYPPGQTTIVVGQQGGYQKWSWGIVVLSVFGLVCCQCFGIVSLLAAMTAYTDHKAQDYAGEARKRKIAKGFGIAAIVIGVIAIIIFIISYVALVVSAVNALSSNNYYNG